VSLSYTTQKNMPSIQAVFLRAQMYNLGRYNDRIKNLYYIKNIHYGAHIESYIYHAVKVTFKAQRDNYQKATTGEKKDYSLARARESVYRIAEANIGQHGRYNPIFFTLTTADQISERKESNRKIKQMARRLKMYLGYKPQYLIVPELHDSKAIHYHGIFFNIPYIDVQYFRHYIWRYGYIDFKLPRNIRSTSAYLAKYLTKSYKQAIPLHQKCYFTSRGMLKPETHFDSLDHSKYNKLQKVIKLKNVTIKKYVDRAIRKSQERSSEDNPETI